MKFLKKLLVAILIFVILAFAASFLLPSKLHIERAIDINAPISVVFAQVNTPANWENFDPWLEDDSTIVSTFDGPESGVGAKRSWKSETSGSGSLTILEVKENSFIKNKIEFIEPSESEADDIWTFSEDKGFTHVTWVNEWPLGNKPVRRYMALFMNKMIGKKFEKGLLNLKTYCEAKQVVGTTGRAIKIIEKEIEKEWMLSIRSKGTPFDAPSFHQQNYESIADFLKVTDAKIIKKHIAIIHKWDQDSIDIQTGILIDRQVSSVGNIICSMSPSGKVLSTLHTGYYERLQLTHVKFKNWMIQNNMKATGPPWHIYRTDPNDVATLSKWKTEVIYPID